MRNDFRPNGGRELMHGTSYTKMAPICNHAMVEMIEGGKAIAFTKAALREMGYWISFISVPWSGHRRLEK